MSERTGEKREARTALGALDVVAVVAAMLGLGALWAVQVAVVPTFVAMYADFGSEVALPALTQLVARPTAAVGVSLLVLALIGGGLGLRLGRRRTFGGIALAGAASLPWLAVPAVMVGLYLPIFALAGAVAP